MVDSLWKEYPLGLIYFVKVGEDKYEVLDGQQRITSFGRFVTGKFAVLDKNGMQQNFDGLDGVLQKRILDSKLTIYVCEGEEPEIKEWFKTINIAGEPLNEQELLNAIYSGPFVTAAKEEFSNSNNANLPKWKSYVKGNEKRQDILETALHWVSRGDIDGYMGRHRRDADIRELKTYFKTVIDWVDGVFERTKNEMCGLDWGRLYETYHKNAYSPKKVWERVESLYADDFLNNRRGIFEYVLGGEKDTRLLDVRVFDTREAKAVYAKQTAAAEKKGVSNCPLCAVGHAANRTRIYKFAEMDADHVAAWSKGGATDIRNCQMLCKTHNRAKGNVDGHVGNRHVGGGVCRSEGDAGGNRLAADEGRRDKAVAADRHHAAGGGPDGRTQLLDRGMQRSRRRMAADRVPDGHGQCAHLLSVRL